MNIKYLLLLPPISWAKGTKQGSGLGRTLCLAALFVTFATAAWADVVINSTNFPDGTFRTFVTKNFDTEKPKGSLSDAELQAVTEMDVSKKSIGNLEGIEYFTALKTLKCFGNKLTQLDVSALTNLVTLECYDNSSVMTTLKATGCTALKTLKCYNSKLEALSLGRCSNLATLDCHSNQLTALNISACVKLTSVSCYRNSIRGDKMVQFIKSLPPKTSNTYLNLIYNEDASSGNEIMHAQVLAAKAKKWTVRRRVSTSWSAYVGIVAVDETTFPDANFLECVGQYDTDNDGILSDAEVAKVEEMYVGEKGIQDMTGIECFENLTYLDCCKNQIRDQWADILISYLPTVEGGGLGFWDREPPTGNYLTQEQLEAFTAKGWNVYELKHGYDDEWVTYVPNNHTGIYIDETTFTDEDFRQWVGRGIDENRDGYLSDDERTAVKKIDLSGSSNYSMVSFQGIEYFPELEVLNCYKAQPTSLDLSGNPKLTSLTCKSYYLTSIDLLGCPLLSYLSLSGNFTSIDLSGCPLLSELYLTGNFTSLDLSNYTQLTRFSCDSEVITSLNMSGCSQLEYLSCNNNTLSSLNVSGCTKLKTLTCMHTELTSIDVSDCKQVLYLNINDNPKLTSLKASDLPLLDQIYLQNCQLTTLDLSNCTSLRYLNTLSGNPLTSINVSGCTSLETLNAYNMQLTSLSVTGCTKLYYMLIYKNRLQGKEMDAFVESMPVCSNPEYAYLDFLYIFDPAEGNRLTPAQAAKLKEKGWSVQAYYKPYGTRLDYDGYGNGDVDGSGTVDADDVRAVVNHILGLADAATDTDTDVEMVATRAMEESATPFYSPVVADTNGDGVVDITDVTQIISKVGTVVYKKPEK